MLPLLLLFCGCLALGLFFAVPLSWSLLSVLVSPSSVWLLLWDVVVLCVLARSCAVR